MSGYVIAETGNLFDPATGAWVGVVDKNGKEQLVTSVGDSTVTSTRTLRKNISSRRVLRVNDGVLTYQGKHFNHVGVNMWDGFYEYLKGGTNYITDLATIASYGVKIIRVSATPNTSADITTYIGSDATAPTGTYLTKLRTFLDECAKNDIGVILTVCWDFIQLTTALSGARSDWSNSGSAVRLWVANLATTLATNFVDHPALAAYNIANEWSNYAWLSIFLNSSSTPPASTHIDAMISAINQTVTAIRTVDTQRAITAPTGTIGCGLTTSGEWKSYARRLVRSAGNCDVVAIHIYPDHYTDSNLGHSFVGRDMGAATRFLNAVRAEARLQGKEIIIEECNADYDSPVNGSVVTATFAAARAAGVPLTLDWGWYTITNGGASDLKSTRLAVMATIKAANVALDATPVAPQPVYPETMPHTGQAFKSIGTAGASGSWIKIPNHVDIYPVSGSPFFIMFWLKKTSQLSSARRLIASNDGTGGLLITTSDQGSSGLEDWVNFQVGVSGTYKGLTGSLNNGATPGEFHHYAFYWDGVASGSSVMCSWLDGVMVSHAVLTNVGTVNAATRDLHFLASTDVSTVNPGQMFDVILGKSELTTAMVDAYITSATVPSVATHRWTLNGDARDSIGSLHGTVGAAATFVENGIGGR